MQKTHSQTPSRLYSP